MATLVTAADLATGAYDGRLVREVLNGDLQMKVYVLRGAAPHMGRVRVTLAALGYAFEDLLERKPGQDYSERIPTDSEFYVMGAHYVEPA